MILTLSILLVIYILLAIVIFFEARHLQYGVIISTMMGLLFTSVVFVEVAMKIINWSMNLIHRVYFKSILILCGTDHEEFMTRMTVQNMFNSEK